VPELITPSTDLLAVIEQMWHVLRPGGSCGDESIALTKRSRDIIDAIKAMGWTAFRQPWKQGLESFSALSEQSVKLDEEARRRDPSGRSLECVASKQLMRAVFRAESNEEEVGVWMEESDESKSYEKQFLRGNLVWQSWNS
jgi:hypothetical protein